MCQRRNQAPRNSVAIVSDLAPRYRHHFNALSLQLSDFQPIAFEGHTP